MAKPTGRGIRGLNIRLVGGMMSMTALVALTFIWFLSGNGTAYTAITATRTIPAGATFLETDYVAVILKDVPEGSMLITEADAATFIGRVATSEIFAGALLQQSNFYKPAADQLPPLDPGKYATRFTEVLTGDQRAVALIGDPTSTYARPGDHVDVYFVGEFAVHKMFTKTIIYTVPRVDPANSESQDALPIGTAIVLDLTSQEAQDLIFAGKNGEIRIALAAPTSVNIPTTVETTFESFKNTYGVTLIQGDEPVAPPPVDPLASPEPSDSVILPTPTDGAPALPSASPSAVDVTLPSASPAN